MSAHLDIVSRCSFFPLPDQKTQESFSLSSTRTLLMSDSVKSVAFTGYDWQLLFELSLPLLPVRVERMEDLLFLWEGRL